MGTYILVCQSVLENVSLCLIPTKMLQVCYKMAVTLL